MKTEYKRDLHFNYMILTEGRKMEPDNYKIRMLEHNRIPGLLDCSVHSMDLSLSFYYDISSRQPLSDRLEKENAGADLIRLIFRNLLRTLDSLGEYLLDADGLMLEPSMIYLDAEGNDLKFCYWPASDSSILDQLRSLSEALLPKLDQNDREAVNMGYKFYSAAMADEVTVDFFRQILGESGRAERNSRHERTGPAEDDRNFSGREEEDPYREVGLYREEEGSCRAEGSCRMEGSCRAEGNSPHDLDSAVCEIPLLQKEQEMEAEKQRRKILLLKAIPFLLAAIAMLLAIWTGYILQGAGFSLVLAAAGLLVDLRSSRKEKRRAANRRRAERKTTGSRSTGGGQTNRSRAENTETDFFSDDFTGGICEPEEKDQRPEGSGHPSSYDLQEDGQTVLLEDYEEKQEKQPACLVSEEDGQKLVLERNFYLLGKSPSAADLIIDGAAVSRLHAKLHYQDEEWKLSDLNSRNGTFVNNCLLQPGEEKCLKEGDRIRIANRSFLFHQTMAQ